MNVSIIDEEKMTVSTYYNITNKQCANLYVHHILDYIQEWTIENETNINILDSTNATFNTYYMEVL